MDRRLRDIYELFDEMLSALEKKEKRLNELIAIADRKIEVLRSLSKGQETSEEDFLGQPIVQEIISLYRKGLGTEEIMKRTGRHKGEIELIVNLYRARYESSSG